MTDMKVWYQKMSFMKAGGTKVCPSPLRSRLEIIFHTIQTNNYGARGAGGIDAGAISTERRGTTVAKDSIDDSAQGIGLVGCGVIFGCLCVKQEPAISIASHRLPWL